MKRRVTSELLERLIEQHGAALELFASQWTESPEDCVQDATQMQCFLATPGCRMRIGESCNGRRQIFCVRFRDERD